MYRRDTIAAIATPPGTGGIGIIRLSGVEAASVAARLFEPARSGEARSHVLRRGRAVDAAGETIDEVLGVLMGAPRSYTGEDVFELHCHGNHLILQRFLARCCECGARAAEPGEFTRRAFLNGRLDLVQAEAVAELISARTEAAARTGVRHLSGALSASLHEVREMLVRIRARAEVLIDFAEEDVDIDPEDLVPEIEAVLARIEKLLDSHRGGRLLRDGFHLALVGRPNVGKSSLLNALLGRDRAIVTPVAGTTRDVIAESLEIDGVPVVLADTAGVRSRADEIERLGIERTRQEASSADAVLLVLDRAEPLTPDDRTLIEEVAPCVIAVVNKADLPAAWQPASIPELARWPVVEVSALSGAGLDGLRGAIRTLFQQPGADPMDPVVTLVRHADALARARESLEVARDSFLRGTPVDVAAVDIQAAVEHIGSITGEVTTEEVLDRIFRDFCIGK